MAAADLNRPHPEWARWLVPVVAVAVATVAMLALTSLGGPATPFLVFFGAIMISAWYGAQQSGLVATALSSVVAWYLFLPPKWSFLLEDFATMSRLLIFTAEGVMISYLCGRLHSARSRAAGAVLEAGRERQTTRESERQYRLMVENVRDYAMFMTDAENRVTKWNTGAERLLGWKEQEILGRPGALIFTPEDRESGQPEKEVSQARQAGHAADERWHLRHDGSRFFASGMMMAAIDEHGQLIGFTKVLRDVTERQVREEQLRESERRVRLLMDATAEGIYGLDSQGNCTFANAACARMLGYDTAEELVGKDMHRLMHHHYPDHTIYPEEKCPIHRTLENTSGVHSDADVFWRKDGTSFPVEYWSHPAAVIEGKVELSVVTFLNIAQRREAQEELRKFKFITDTANDSLVLIDRQGRIVYANRFACEQCGYEEGGMVGLTVPELDPVFTREKFQLLFELAKSERVPTFESVHRRKDGSEFPVEITVTYVELSAAPYLFAASRNITERKRAEAERRENESRFRAALAIANLGTFEWRLADNVLALDSRSREIFGFAPGEGNRAEEVFARIDPRDVERVTAEVEKARTTQTHLETEYRINLPDGTGRSIVSISDAVIGVDGKAERMFGVFSDVTERRRSEMALRASEERHRAILAALTEGVTLHDATGKIVMANPSAERIFGLCFEQMLGRDCFDPYCEAVAEDGTRLPDEQHPSQIALRTGERITNAVLGIHLPDGRLIWLSANAIPLRDPQTDQVAGVVVSVFEITARKAADEERERLLGSERVAREAAETANAAKDRFLAVLSHELRNPLAPVLGAASLLLEDPRLPEDLREEAVTIKRNAQLEARLIDDLLDLSRIAKGKMHLEMQPVDVHALISQAVIICRPEIEAKEVKVSIAPEAARSTVIGDPARLQQVLWNLLRNAIKFTRPGTAIRVETQNEADGSLVVRVTDEGVGIAREDLERIFRPFEQAVRTSQFGGLGLGLTISRTLADLHHGRIHVESPGIDQGATFILTVPTVVGRTEGGDSPEREPVTQAKAPAPGLQILLVEDHADAARTMSRLLTRKGHTVHTATSVAEGLVIAEKQPLDVVVSDIGLGGESGLDLMRALKAKHPNLPGVALSGYGMEGDISKSLQAGFVSHLTKPVDAAVLQEAIGAAVRSVQ